MKKILISLMVIWLVAAMMGGGVFSYFSDTETSSDNTFTAGTLDLTLSNWSASVDKAGAGSNATASGGTSFSITNVAPGDTSTTTIDTTNSGNIDAESLKFHVAVSDSEPTVDTEPEVAAESGTDTYDISTKITVSTLSWDGTPDYAVNDQDSDGWTDLVEVVAGKNPNDSGDQPPATDDNVVTLSELACTTFDITDVDDTDRDLAAGATETLTMKLMLQTGTGNEYQGDMSTIDLTLDAYQQEQP